MISNSPNALLVTRTNVVIVMQSFVHLSVRRCISKDVPAHRHWFRAMTLTWSLTKRVRSETVENVRGHRVPVAACGASNANRLFTESAVPMARNDLVLVTLMIPTMRSGTVGNAKYQSSTQLNRTISMIIPWMLWLYISNHCENSMVEIFVWWTGFFESLSLNRPLRFLMDIWW